MRVSNIVLEGASEADGRRSKDRDSERTPAEALFPIRIETISHNIGVPTRPKEACKLDVVIKLGVVNDRGTVARRKGQRVEDARHIVEDQRSR